MLISAGFDESNKERRDRIFVDQISTAERLNQRIHHFLKNVEKNHSLSKERKKKIKQSLLKYI